MKERGGSDKRVQEEQQPGNLRKQASILLNM